MKYKKHILKQIQKQRNELVRKIAEVERLIADIPDSDWKSPMPFGVGASAPLRK